MARRQDWHSKYEGQEVEDILDAVHDKTIYSNATINERGLMSAPDKQKLNSLEDWDAMSNMEIMNVINQIF